MYGGCSEGVRSVLGKWCEMGKVVEMLSRLKSSSSRTHGGVMAAVPLVCLARGRKSSLSKTCDRQQLHQGAADALAPSAVDALDQLPPCGARPAIKRCDLHAGERLSWKARLGGWGGDRRRAGRTVRVRSKTRAFLRSLDIHSPASSPLQWEHLSLPRPPRASH